MEERIIAFLEENEGEFTPDQIAQELDVAEVVVVNRLYDLKKAGRIGDINQVSLSETERVRLRELRQRKQKQEEREELDFRKTKVDLDLAERTLEDRRMNNYMKVLSYLKQFEGDGQMHDIDALLDPIDRKLKDEIYLDLAKEEFILLSGGHGSFPIHILKGGDSCRVPIGSKSHFPFKAKITFKGANHLKQELEMQKKEGIIFSVGNNSNVNFINHSPNASAVIQHRPEILEKVKFIIETVKGDASLSEQRRAEAVAVLEQLINETNQGTPSKETFNALLAIGANISSIGSMG